MTSPTESPEQLSEEELKSLTHGEFSLEQPHRGVYQTALRALNRSGPPTVVSGLYALWQHTGIYRKTKDLDLMFRPDDVVAAARVLKDEGFRTVLIGPHWLAKAFRGEVWIDLVFGMANGLHLVDDPWIENARDGHFLGVPVRVAAPEDLVFHRLFIWERHRSDMADIAHLFLSHGPRLDWDRLVRRVGGYWRLLLAQIHFFDFVYPGHRERIPRHVRETLLDRSRAALDEDVGPPRVCQGTLISRFSFAIDVNEWGFRDFRREAVEASHTLPIVEEIAAADVWDEVDDDPEEAQMATTDADPQTSPAPWGPAPTGVEAGP